jgi:predicted RNA-binding Zn ribbon-like protein
MIGGNLCLDFTNTAEHRGDAHFRDLLVSYSHWLIWCWRSSTVTEEAAERLLEAADQTPDKAATALRYVVEVREAIYTAFSAIIDHTPEQADLTRLNAVLGRIPPEQLVWTGEGFTTVPISTGATDDLERPLWPVALAAKELLLSEQLGQVRKCPNCGWLFVDTSRNGKRRWCSMDYCGSKVKSRRQYERRRKRHTD